MVKDVGKLFECFGYVDVVWCGIVKLSGDLQWSGLLIGIDYLLLIGQMMVYVEKGQFNKLEFGVGKLFGLILL